MRVKFLAQGNNGGLWWGLNSRLTGIHRSQVRRATHCATLPPWILFCNNTCSVNSLNSFICFCLNTFFILLNQSNHTYLCCLLTGESSTDGSPNQTSEAGDPLTCPIIPGQEMSIVIEKGRTGLGLSIVGGADTLLVSTPSKVFKSSKWNLLYMIPKYYIFFVRLLCPFF